MWHRPGRGLLAAVCFTVALLALPASADDANPVAPLATLPLEYVQGLPLLQARINGRDIGYLLFDTGGSFALDAQTSDALALPRGKPIRLLGMGTATAQSQRIRATTLQLGDLTLQDVDGVNTDLSFLRQAFHDVPVVGIIGAELYLHQPLAIDHDHDELRVYPPGSNPFAGKPNPVPLLSSGHDGQKLVVPARIGNSDSKIVLDSGYDAALAIVGEHAGSLQRTGPLRRLVGSGIGGTNLYQIALAEPISLFGQRLPPQVAEFYLSPQSAAPILNEIDAYVGPPLLRRFNLYIDKPRALLHAELRPPGCEHPQYGNSGLIAWKTAQGFAISTVLPHSPAANAGLRRGMLITRVDSLPADAIGQCELDSKLDGATGTRVRLRLQTPAPDAVELQLEPLFASP
ncbi:aspartyl protease family protein [Andreprevotia lacus]|uniref:aspartyl protease family protein n=1 Tax=Andreprevotia lacus TaxID=1121000 RepID=UPI001594AF40|nr:aspartyl protease family protein [Andreprevotia lacus]